MYQFISISDNEQRIHASRERRAECMIVMKRYHRVMEMVPGVTTSAIVNSEEMTGFTADTTMGHKTVFKVVEVVEPVEA